jgi:hypothetical protein
MDRKSNLTIANGLQIKIINSFHFLYSQKTKLKYPNFKTTYY